MMSSRHRPGGSVVLSCPWLRAEGKKRQFLMGLHRAGEIEMPGGSWSFGEKTKLSVGRVSRKCYKSFIPPQRAGWWEVEIILPEIKIQGWRLHLSLRSVMYIYWFQLNIQAADSVTVSPINMLLFLPLLAAPESFPWDKNIKGNRCTGLAPGALAWSLAWSAWFSMCPWGIIFSFWASISSCVTLLIPLMAPAPAFP